MILLTFFASRCFTRLVTSFNEAFDELSQAHVARGSARSVRIGVVDVVVEEIEARWFARESAGGSVGADGFDDELHPAKVACGNVSLREKAMTSFEKD